jgi:hypothetical protein
MEKNIYIIRSFIIVLLIQYCLANFIKKDEMGGECSTHTEMRNQYEVLAENPLEKRSLGRTRRR